jgi:hypothetical protein
MYICLCTHHEGAGGKEILRHSFLTSALEGDKCSASRPGTFTLRGRAPGID